MLDTPVEQLKVELVAARRELAELRERLAQLEAAPADVALQASRAVLQGVLDSAVSGILALDAVRDETGRIVDFRFTLANPTSERMVFRTVEEMIGNTLLELFPGNIESGLFDRYVTVTETGVPVETDTYYRDERLEFWLNVSAVKVGDGVAITFTDISARKRAEAEAIARSKELAQRKAFAENIIKNVPTGICYLDRDLVYRVANPVYCEFLQMAPEQIIDRYLFDVVPGGEDTILPIFRAALDRAEPCFITSLPFTYFGPDGEERQTYWDASYLPMVQDENGEVDGVLVLANEVSQRIQNERLQSEQIRMLELTDKMKDQFLSILSHELRTPINAIMGFGSVLDDELVGPLNDEQRKYTGRVLGGAETLLALINDLLDMSRIQAGKFTLEPKTFGLPDLITDVVANLSSLADKKNQSIQLAIAEDLPPLTADPQRVSQILVNLVGNAIKFTPVAGRITLRAHVAGDGVVTEVEDTGVGIAAEDLPKLFKPFTQLDSSNTRSASGTGLGLSIAKALIEAHGGSIRVDSTPGAGTTFAFTLPIEPDGRSSGQLSPNRV